MTMPLVKANQAGDQATAKIARKINDRLSFIDSQGNESQQFTVSRHDDRILTIAFDNEGCGAYCENYSTWYNFDQKDGSLLTAANLFTPKGMRALATRLRQEQISRYRKQLTELAKSLKAAQTKPTGRAAKTSQTKVDVISDLEARIALNEDCLDKQIARTKEPASRQVPTVFDYPGYIPFELAEKAFKLNAARCSNHASHALDDVYDVVLSLPYPELAPWLTAYGK
ncbi:MAG: hypothetical protein H7228_03775 [Polaromonas sp.]|nr:hypothetical protein [Polaromonas sp.]